MDDLAQIEQVAEAIAAAIEAKDDRSLQAHLADDFVLRKPGQAPVGPAEFLASVRELPVEMVFVRLEDVAIDVCGDSALATGIQHARAQMDGEMLDDARPFVDYFVKRAGRWQLRVALDFGGD